MKDRGEQIVTVVVVALFRSSGEDVRKCTWICRYGCFVSLTCIYRWCWVVYWVFD